MRGRLSKGPETDRPVLNHRVTSRLYPFSAGTPTPASRFEGPTLIGCIVTQNCSVLLSLTILLVAQLEIQLSPELHLPGAVGRVTHYPKAGVVDGGVRCTENRMIERILGLQAQLEPHSFVNSRQRKLLLN